MTMPLPSDRPLWRAAFAARIGGRVLLAQALRDSRARTLALFDAFEAALHPVGMAVPYDVTLNPPLWELGHIGWFQEVWLARNPQRALGVQADPLCPRLPPQLVGADALYNSSEVPHASRWQLPLPDADATRAYVAATLDGSLELLAHGDESAEGLYFHRLALFHEDMHAEAAVYMAQALGITLAAEWAFPGQAGAAESLLRDPGAESPGAAGAAMTGAVRTMPACSWTLGSRPGEGFAFDNELAAHPVALAVFEIDAAPVSWARYLPFVEAGGYQDARWWSPEGWRWVQESAQRRSVFGQRAGEGAAGTGPGLPRDLRRDEGVWFQRRFDRWQPLDLQSPAVHLSAFEADAWCRWAGRRLPTEAEWECAAMTLPSAQTPFQWGRVWEWTASTFEPYPGFEPHPYRDYSAPWFGTRRVLRGASAATSPRMAHPKYRNFFTPERNDIFAGFRSCALTD
jgi:ergothioneine biosynthesis protein EgtB